MFNMPRSRVKESTSHSRRPAYLYLMAAIVALSSGCADRDRTSVLAQINVGEQFLSNGQYDKAYAALDDVGEKNPKSAPTALALGDAYFRQGAMLKASAQYQKAIGLNAKAEGLLGLAKTELARNNQEQAKILFRQVLVTNPGNVDAINGIGVAYDLAGSHDVAQQYYNKVLSLKPADRKALNNLSLSLALSGQPDLAAPRIAELSRSFLNDKTIRQNLAIIQYLSRQENQALGTAELDLDESDARRNFQTIRDSLQ